MKRHEDSTVGNLVERLFSINTASGPVFSGDGQHLYFLMNLSEVRQVWRTKINAGGCDPVWPEQITFSSERVYGCWFSPTQPDRFIFASDQGGNENPQLFYQSIDNPDPRLLTPGEERAVHMFGKWLQDGKHYVYISNKRHPGYFDLWLGALEEEDKLLWKNETYGFIHSLDISSDDSRVVISLQCETFEHDLLEIEIATGQSKQLVSPVEPARFECLQCSKDTSTLYFLTDIGHDFLYLARLDMNTGKIQELVKTDRDIELMTRSIDDVKILYIINNEGSSDLYLFDLTTGQTIQAPLEGQGVVGEPMPFTSAEGFTFSPDMQHAAFAYTSPKSTTDILYWTFSDNTLKFITRAPMGGFKAQDFHSPRLIHVASFDGLQIPALLYEPNNEFPKPWPVMFMVHGGPVGQSRFMLNPLAQLLVMNGIAVCLPNVRGSNGYGKAYALLDEVEKRMDSVKDLACCAQWIGEQARFDADRIGVYGGSYGGFMVLASMTHFPEYWKAGIDVVGIGNFITFLENTSEYRREHREAEYGSLAKDRDFLNEMAPINHLDRINAPLMIIHGENDPRVPISESYMLYDHLKQRDIPVEKIIFADEGHGVFKTKNKKSLYPKVLTFLKKYL